MMRLTDSEVDCVINAVRPLDGSARDAFLREVASALGSCPGIGDDVVLRRLACAYLTPIVTQIQLSGSRTNRFVRNPTCPATQSRLQQPGHLGNTCQELGTECEHEQQLPQPRHDCVSHGMWLRASKSSAIGGADGFVSRRWQ